VTRSRLVLLLCVVVYLFVSLDHLSVFPAVGEDESWIAAAPYKLATEGVYGSDVFAGYYGVERHNYQHMPLYPLAQAAIFRVFGAGVLQMRLLPVSIGLALLLVTFLVGSAVGDARVGAAAAVLMVGLSLAGATDATGVLLLDRARINRYDIAVPVFGLLAFWAFMRADRTGGGRWYVLTGILTGLASLSHLFGGFWLPILLMLVLCAESGWPRRAAAACWVLLGFAGTWVPWLVYIASGWEDYLGQMRFVSSRFDVFSPLFYVSNIQRDGPISVVWLADTLRHLPWNRPGAWVAFAGVPAATVLLAWTGRREAIASRGFRLLAVAGLAQLVMFITFLQVKTINYMIGIWPLAVLLLAWLGVWLWDRRPVVTRGLVLVALALILAEGSIRIVHFRSAARLAMPYDWYSREIAACIPDGSRVLGLQHYWLGLRQYDYRTWLMATNLAHPSYYHDPMPLDAALDRIDPDIILVDRFMSAFFESASRTDHRFHYMREGYDRFMARRGAHPICAIQNHTYGTMYVYQVPKPAGGR